MNKHAVVLGFLLVFWPSLIVGQVPANWSPRGVGAGGALYSPSINPANDSEYYVACDMSELFHTVDFGNSYAVVPFTQEQGGHDSAVRFTNNPNIAYTVSYSGDIASPVKTTDGGQTWSVLAGNPLPYDDVYSVWADYDNPSWVIVAGYSNLYFSADGGNSFKSINVAIDSGSGALVGGAFFNGNGIYLGTSAGLIVSTDGGKTWVNAGTPGIPSGEYIRSFAGAKSGSTVRFFCLTVADTYPGQDVGADYWGDFRGVYSMDNAAGNWTAHSAGLNPNSDFLMFIAMAANDINTVYAGGSTDLGWGQVPEIVKTANAGQSWTNVFQAANNQNINTGWSGRGGDRDWTYGEVVFGLATAPNNSAKVVFTDMGFVHRTADGGATWQQAYVNPSDQHAMNTTAIAGGSYHSIGIENTSCWQVVWSDAQTMFAGFTDIKGIRSTDGGLTWSFKYTGDNANTMYRILKHPANGNLYAGTSDIHDMYQSTRLADNPLNNNDANGKIIFSTDKGATWQILHTFGHPVFWIALDPNNTNRMYASVVHSTAGGVFVSNDLQDGAASTWTKLPNPPRTEGHPASIVVLNDGSVVCTYSGHRSPTTSAFTASSGVFIYSPATGTWSDVSDPGMDYWTKDIVLDPSDPAQNAWYVGVFSGWGGPPNGLGGLYHTVDRGTHWTRVNSLDRVTSVTFNPTNANDVFLTTETEGLWHTSNIHASTPVFSLVANYPFRQPERVYFNPYNSNEIWVTSFGNGLVVGLLNTVTPTTPTITWPQPAAITYGTALSVSQLDATANVPGTFVYTPAAGTVLNVGTQTLTATFTPTDSTDYTTATATQTLPVISVDQAFLQQLFPAVLGRPVDSGALTAYLAAMSGGRTRAQVFGDLIASSEFTMRQIEPVIRLYQAAFARMPDYAGLQNWSNALQAGALSLTGAADQFAGSAEFLLKYGALDNTGYVQQLYRNVLGREADPAGLADWVNQLNGGATRGTILVGFSESPEFQTDMANQVEIIRLYDLLLQRMPTTAELQSWLGFLQGYDQTDTLFAQGHPLGLADADYVQLVFQGFLRRAADTGALSSFGTALTAGTVTHASLVQTLLTSTEFNMFVAPVSRLYMAAFHRVPDAGGLDNWVAYVRAGNPLQSAADAFVASPEFQLTYGSLNDTQYVTLLYENVLGREPDPTGLTNWTGQLASGWTRGQVLIGFSESEEGIALFAPTVRTFLHYFTFLNATPAQSDLDYWKNYLATLNDQMRETVLTDLGDLN
jgi:photosystem II stability/assembly factor-like uncharacterized protein